MSVEKISIHVRVPSDFEFDDQPQPKKRSPMVDDLGGSEKSLSDDERTGVLFAALARREGYELYRPDECPWVTIDARKGAEQGVEWWSLIAERGALTDEAIYEQYRLVPISEEMPKVYWVSGEAKE